MYKAFLLIIISLTYVISATNIKGKVYDEDGNILKDVKITIRGCNCLSHTDKNGHFNIKTDNNCLLKNKKIKLIFSKKDYYIRNIFINIKNIKNHYSVVMIKIKKIFETISVTALNRKESELKTPMAGTILCKKVLSNKLEENIVNSMMNNPGIGVVGKGGYSKTPSIRGMARRRILLCIDGLRVSGDRSVGNSASFLIPGMINGIDIVRSSSSVFYGSDAIGGLINIHTRPDFEKEFNGNGAININYETVNGRKNAGYKIGKKYGKLYLYGGFQFLEAENYKIKDIEIYNSGYENFSGILDLSYKSDKRDFYFGYIMGNGNNIGKPNRKNDPNETSTVLKDLNQYFRFGFNEYSFIKGVSLSFLTYLNPTVYKIKKLNKYKGSEKSAITRALNIGVKAFLSSTITNNLQLQTGFDIYNRLGINVENEVIKNDTAIKTMPLQNANRSDIAPFFALSYKPNSHFSLEAGSRYSFVSLSAEKNEERKNVSANSPSFFLGLNNQFNNNFSIFVNIGKAFRVPSISELYYSGISGRKFLVGNDSLIPEYGVNIDAGVKYFKEEVSFGLYFFHNNIKNLIEKYRMDNEIYTYDNLNDDKTYGCELEFSLPIIKKTIEIAGYYSLYKGVSFEDIPLNDVPSSKLFLNLKLKLCKIDMNLSYLHSFAKNDPGPAEVSNVKFNLINFNSIYSISTKIRLIMKITNILNSKYYANADPDIPYEKGRSLVFGIIARI